jgi:hypothetical protein
VNSEDTIFDPLLNKESELIVEDKIQSNSLLMQRMIADIKSMSDKSRHEILSAMLKLHKHLEGECGDLDVSLDSENEILENTKPRYIILDESSELEKRAVRYHYEAFWETGHGVEVIVINGNLPIFVGNCGRARSIDMVTKGNSEKYNFL